MPKEDAIDQMSGVRQDVRKRMDIAIAAIVALCWEYRSPDFTFSGHLALQREVNKVLAQMSDGILSDSEKRAVLALAEAELQDYEEDALEFAEGEVRGEDMIFRLDRHGDHIKDLIAGWIAVAAYAGLTKEKTIQNFWTFLGDVGASIEWRKAGLKTPRWGRGFQLDTLSAMTVVGQDMINRAFQFARIKFFQAKGAIGYRTIRQSNYICPLCDDMCKRTWTFEDKIPLPYHPRCVCKAVPIYTEEGESQEDKPKEKVRRPLTDEQKAHRKDLQEWARENIKGEVVENKYPIMITMRGIKEYLNQPHELYFIKNELVKELPLMIEQSQFIKSKPHSDLSNFDIIRDHIYKTSINGKESYLIIWENRAGEYIFHSISDSARVLKE